MPKSKLLLLPLMVLSLNSCAEPEHENAVFTSFYPLYDFTKRIVGDKYEVVNITPPGSEPHDYEPKAREVVGMTVGKAVLVNGLGMENWTENLPDELKEKTYTVTEGIRTKTVDGVVDGHVWLSVPNAIQEMKNIRDIMCNIDPDNSSYFKANYEREVQSFTELDKEYREIISGLSNKYLVVSHAAFGYLCEEYGLTQIYVSGLSPDKEPTPREMESIIEKVREYKVRTIFSEELFPQDIANKIAEETGVGIEELNPLEGLTAEELKSEDYLSVMKENLKKIKEANQ